MAWMELGRYPANLLDFTGPEYFKGVGSGGLCRIEVFPDLIDAFLSANQDMVNLENNITTQHDLFVIHKYLSEATPNA